MKKVLIIQNVIPSYRKPIYNGLARNYDITVMHSGMATAEPEDAYKEIVVRAHRLGPFIIQKRVFSELSSGKFDVVIMMFDLRWLSCVLTIMFRSRLRYAKWILWGHGYGRMTSLDYVRDLLMKKVDAVLLYNRRDVDKMIRRGIQESKLFIANNTIYVPNHCDYSRHEKNCLLFVGVMNTYKKIDLLIEAFAHIHKDIPNNTQLEIVGGPRPRESEFSHSGPKFDHDPNLLYKKVVEFDLMDKVIFHDETYRHDQLAEIFSRAYAYVSPGHVGLGVLHSFAYGVPVITHNRSNIHAPEFMDLKHGHNAILYESNEELKEMMIEICNSPQLATTLGENAYQFYSSERTLDIMLNRFKEAIEG